MNDYSDGPVWHAFGLTRASYFVMSRRALQSMPREWQEQFVELMNKLNEQIPDAEPDCGYTVTMRDGGKFVHDYRREYRHSGPMPRKSR